MGDPVKVRVGDAIFLMQIAGDDVGGPRNVGLDDAFAFDGIRETVRALASEMGQVWQQVRPSEATVQFELSAKIHAGKLTGLVLSGEGGSCLTVSLTWRSADNEQRS